MLLQPATLLAHYLGSTILAAWPVRVTAGGLQVVRGYNQLAARAQFAALEAVGIRTQTYDVRGQAVFIDIVGQLNTQSSKSLAVLDIVRGYEHAPVRANMASIGLIGTLKTGEHRSAQASAELITRLQTQRTRISTAGTIAAGRASVASTRSTAAGLIIVGKSTSEMETPSV